MPITKAIIIHGTGATPNSNWFPWIKEELGKCGLNVFIPQFPAGEKQNLINWMSEFSKWSSSADEETIMIGHNIGSAFILNFLEKRNNRIAAAFLVAPFIGKLDLQDFDPMNRTFVEKEFNWNKIRSQCHRFYIYSSDSDPYVPLEKGEYLSTKLHSIFKIIRQGGHLNATSGYTKFEPLLADIKKLLESRSTPQ